MFTGQSFAKIDPETCVGKWLFDESAGDVTNDSSGKGNDGEIHGAQWVDGKFGRALEFNGTSDYVDCGNDASLNITDEITVAAWIKTPQPTKNFQMFVTHGQAVWELRFNSTTGTVHFCANINGVWIDQTEYATKTILSADTWYHVVGTFNGSRITTWLNGTDDGHFDASGSIPSTANSVNMGKRVEGGDYNFLGAIDEVAIFNVVLTEDDIQDLALGLQHDVSPKEKLTTTWSTIKSP